MTQKNKLISIYSLTILLIFLIGIISLMIGSTFIPFSDIILFLKEDADLSATTGLILQDIRLPRIILSLLVGSGLAVAGAVFQGVIRNPMVDPYIIGISAGAGTGVTLAFLLGLKFSIAGINSVPIFAFLGSVATVFAVYQLARVDNKLPVMTFLLAGVALSFILNSVMSFLMVIRTENLHKIIYWLMGSLAAASWSDIYMILPYFIIALIIIIFYLKELNIILLGEENAVHLGVNAEKVKLIMLGAASLLTASVVSVSGSIGFIGLVIPHIARMLVGPDHRKLMPLAAFLGGGFLLISDNIARSIMPPLELPVGIITAIAGGPYFIYLLRKKSKNIW
ncbi:MULTISPECIES: iron ABC transporter permease [unclassified Halanaerobium]|uniref:FecCD family ABC transporter permease n=1 Tax=unclassified Halanaerobium TaxID=2641197 RepID=UPI000DF46F37|nr:MULTISPECIES: iron chelate uptake ABC transporter family permease subunit [unclassified Halanaerobium]RCW41172.1 iron complex transport system permease protein [Halanaerobium sp. MA284_MarDTE_T2]RCW79608.1 iron complex transport system permease protein [Halanaerobium sp. DL-01]